MAALAANAATPPRRNPGSAKFEPSFKATGADEYYVGAIVCATSGKALVTNADGTATLGFTMQRKTVAAADEPIKVHVTGIWWVAAVDFADADSLMIGMSPLASSDNPADIVNTSAATPGQLGLVIHIDVTATSGWLDLGQRNIQLIA